MPSYPLSTVLFAAETGDLCAVNPPKAFGGLPEKVPICGAILP